MASLQNASAHGRVGRSIHCRPAPLLVLALATICCFVGGGRAQSIDADLWGVDNTVVALARSGSTLYVGGTFNWVGPCTGGLIALSRQPSSSRRPFPRVAGYVYGIADDGQGGWFISGNFTAVGGVPRNCLAHILSDGTVAPWNPNPNHVPYGTGGLIVSGNRVYVCGGFATISGKPRSYIAALDATTGEALDWNAHANGLVAPLAIHGNVLYVGGGFSQMGGQPRRNIAALDLTTGNATPWNPDADGWVSAVAVHGNHVLVGGRFRNVGGRVRSALAELDPKTGLATDWDAHVGPEGDTEVDAIAVLGDRLYIGGWFTSVSGEVRQSLAAFDLHTRLLESWNPGSEFAANGYPMVFALRSSGHSIYIGGQFDHVAGKPRYDAAELDARTGAATEWNPDPNNIVYAIGASDSLVCLGGWLKSAGMVRRHDLAAFDLSTGQVTAWNPNPDGIQVRALAVDQGSVYVGGAFWSIGGKPRSMLAAVDTLTGAAMDWDPHADDLVNTLLVRDNAVYVGGNFNHIGGQARNYLAALDAATGTATAWNPSPNDYVEAITAIGNTIYAGGWFYMIGDLPRSSAAALDASTGAVLPWQPNVRSVINSLATIGNTVYMGGPFERVNGLPRNGLAAVDGTTGALLLWDPDPRGPREDGFYTSIHALATHGSTVFVGGDFTLIGGQPHASLAALDGVTGAALAWDPNPDQSVWVLDASSDRIFAGGFFQAAQGVPHLALMDVSYPLDPLVLLRRPALMSASPAQTLSLGEASPNPARTSTVVRYSLPVASQVSLAFFDLQGRKIETVVERENQSAGNHELRVETGRWRPGCYLYRLEAGGSSLTRKMMVVR